MFAVLYVAVMGLTTVFYIYICSFSTEFILDAYYCTSLFTVLQKKNERKPYWNTTYGGSHH